LPRRIVDRRVEQSQRGPPHRPQGELVEEARVSDSGLANKRDDLSVALLGSARAGRAFALMAELGSLVLPRRDIERPELNYGRQSVPLVRHGTRLTV
jgi:hypothetical protein